MGTSLSLTLRVSNGDVISAHVHLWNQVIPVKVGHAHICALVDVGMH